MIRTRRTTEDAEPTEITEWNEPQRHRDTEAFDAAPLGGGPGATTGRRAIPESVLSFVRRLSRLDTRPALLHPPQADRVECVRNSVSLWLCGSILSVSPVSSVSSVVESCS